MKTFKIREMKVPDHFIQIELGIEEFKALAEKEDFSPVFELEGKDTFVYIEDDPPTLFYAKRKKEEKPEG